MMSDESQKLYQFSVKISQTAKGAATVDVHVFSNNLEAARVQAVNQYAQVIEDLKAKGLAVAMTEKGGAKSDAS